MQRGPKPWCEGAWIDRPDRGRVRFGGHANQNWIESQWRKRVGAKRPATPDAPLEL